MATERGGGHGVPPLQCRPRSIVSAKASSGLTSAPDESNINATLYNTLHNARFLTMPLFPGFPYPRRYNTLRLLGYNYNSVFKLCAIAMVTDLRRPLCADIRLAKSVLSSLLSDQTLALMRVRAFSLMPDHLHLLAGVRQPEINLPTLLGRFESYTTQLYWKRRREIVESQQVCLPPKSVARTDPKEARLLLAPLMEWRAI